MGPVKTHQFVRAVLFALFETSMLFSCKASAASISSALPSPPDIRVASETVLPSSAPRILELALTIEPTGAEPLLLAGFQMAIELEGPDNALVFDGVGVPVDEVYSFAPESESPLFRVSADGQRIDIGDFLGSGVALVEPGGLSLILRILIAPEIDPQPKLRDYSVNIIADEQETFLALDTTHYLPFNAYSGRVTTGVPEPTSLSFLLLTALRWVFAARFVRQA